MRERGWRGVPCEQPSILLPRGAMKSTVDCVPAHWLPLAEDSAKFLRFKWRLLYMMCLCHHSYDDRTSSINEGM